MKNYKIQCQNTDGFEWHFSLSGILLKWDYGTSVLVTLDPSHAGQVCGLCGNFNGDSSDDFYTRSGAMESSPQLFGRSWRTSENCPDPQELTLPCKSEPHRRAWAESVCSIIKKSIFASCHNLVSFYMQTLWNLAYFSVQILWGWIQDGNHLNCFRGRMGQIRIGGWILVDNVHQCSSAAYLTVRHCSQLNSITCQKFIFSSRYWLRALVRIPPE